MPESTTLAGSGRIIETIGRSTTTCSWESFGGSVIKDTALVSLLFA